MEPETQTQTQAEPASEPEVTSTPVVETTVPTVTSEPSAQTQEAPAAAVDPLAFISNPRRRQLAQMVLDEATDAEFEAAFFAPIVVREMKCTLIKHGLMVGEVSCNC